VGVPGGDASSFFPPLLCQRQPHDQHHQGAKALTHWCLVGNERSPQSSLSVLRPTADRWHHPFGLCALWVFCLKRRFWYGTVQRRTSLAVIVAVAVFVFRSVHLRHPAQSRRVAHPAIRAAAFQADVLGPLRNGELGDNLWRDEQASTRGASFVGRQSYQCCPRGQRLRWKNG
jgi:hypothetical protein